MTTLKIIDDKQDSSFSLGGVTTDELSKNAMGGTEMMKYGLYDRLDPSIRDKVQIICSRVREVDEDRPSILWLHDMYNDPESVHLKDAESRDRFSKLVFVSNWQYTTYSLAMGIPPSQAIVLKNAIEPIEQHEKPDDGIIRMIYHTTPHRGLELLVPAFEAIAQHYSNIHLDVYSSFKAYGWAQRDEPYYELFDRIREHPQMTYHGYQPNEKVREALKEAHIFAYPSIWQETSCIAAMEAMSAGCAIVCPNYGALPETTANYAFMYQMHENSNVHANIFANALANVVDLWQKDTDNVKARLQFQKMYADNFYSWNSRVHEWDALIRGVLRNETSETNS